MSHTCSVLLSCHSDHTVLLLASEQEALRLLLKYSMYTVHILHCIIPYTLQCTTDPERLNKCVLAMISKRVCGLQAGVRSLARNLAAVCRHVAVQIVSRQDSAHITTQEHQHPGTSGPDSVDSHIQDLRASSGPPQLQQQQQQQRSNPHLPSPEHGGPEQQQQQQHQKVHAGFDNGPLDEQDLNLAATVSPGGLFWGSLWGGLRGAFTPAKQHSLSVSRHHQQARHSHHAALSHSDAERDSLSQRQRSRYRPVSGDQPSPSLRLASYPSGDGNLPSRATDLEDQASNPYGGVNADLVKSRQDEESLMTVTAELVEAVLGPRKFNDSDSADSLATPGE